MSGNAVIVFAHDPEAGQVKTRLTPPLSADGAAQVHRACLNYVLAVVRGNDSWRTILAMPPDIAAEQTRLEMGDGAEVWPMEDGDLGARMSGAAQRALEQGADKLVIVGTDSPTCAPRRIAQAFDALNHNDAVMGPCEGGGYYLLGMKRALPGLFDDVEWGSDRVAEHTRRNAAWLGLDFAELPLGYDIDRPENLDRAMLDLAEAAPQSAESHLRDAIESILASAADPASLAATRRGARSSDLEAAVSNQSPGDHA